MIQSLTLLFLLLLPCSSNSMPPCILHIIYYVAVPFSGTPVLYFLPFLFLCSSTLLAMVPPLLAFSPLFLGTLIFCVLFLCIQNISLSLLLPPASLLFLLHIVSLYFSATQTYFLPPFLFFLSTSTFLSEMPEFPTMPAQPFFSFFQFCP